MSEKFPEALVPIGAMKRNMKYKEKDRQKGKKREGRNFPLIAMLKSPDIKMNLNGHNGPSTGQNYREIDTMNEQKL